MKFSRRILIVGGLSLGVATMVLWKRGIGNTQAKREMEAFAHASPAPQGIASTAATSDNAPKTTVVREIVVEFDPVAKSGFDWQALDRLDFAVAGRHKDASLISAVRFFQEAMLRMTGEEIPVRAGGDLSKGLVLTTFAGAEPALQNDSEVRDALRVHSTDSYNANEAYYLRTEGERIVVIANTADGLRHGVVELLASVGYEVLGMGPNWVHAPDYRGKEVEFLIKKADRPGFYIRNLWATSGQERGVGTLTSNVIPMPDYKSFGADEPVEVSYRRWREGTRMAGASMPPFPGHALQGYHGAVLDAMVERGISDGFLVSKSVIGLDSRRPTPSLENKGHLWLNSDRAGEPAAGKAYISDGENWVEQKQRSIGASLDLSVPLVREVILEKIKTVVDARLAADPDDVVVIGTDPEDGGGYTHFRELLKNRNWYPEYLASKGVKFGKPYQLNGLNGLEQPIEIWDPASLTDTVFAFNNWLLRELDEWLDSRPPAEQKTSTGRLKKEALRCSLYSYNFHDVPPNFNLDPRIRVMIAGFPKHRGWDKWKNFKTHADMGNAFRKLLPHEPAGDYQILSTAYFNDRAIGALAGNLPAATVHRRIRETYDAGFRAYSCETDFNFGKFGLTYYLYSKMLWNPLLSVTQLEATRVEWLKKAFGAGWQEMKAYYDFVSPESFMSSPNNWGKAIRLIDAADKKVALAGEEAPLRRIDDLKQFWYYFYLVEHEKAGNSVDAFKEFLWKGQMSYMITMRIISDFQLQGPRGADTVSGIVGAPLNGGPAHYSREETQAWWETILNAWPVTSVTDFASATLANGQKGSHVDLNDLVTVQEFQDPSAGAAGFYFNGATQRHEASFLTRADEAGELIGFRLYWPWKQESNHYRNRDVAYGVHRWNPEAHQWEEFVDITMVTEASQYARFGDGKEYQLVKVELPAPQAGTYRFDIGRTGNAASLAPLDFDPQSRTAGRESTMTFFTTLRGLTQSGTCFYIPKGTASVDLEVWETHGDKRLRLHKGLPLHGMTLSRVVDISSPGTHKVALEAGEDGSLAYIEGNGFAYPYLYSVPLLWAKTSSSLMVPRAIAEADRLTIGKGKRLF